MKELFIRLLLTMFPSFYGYILFRDYKKFRFKKSNWGKINDYEVILLKYLLDRDSVFFDVGANSGLYTYISREYVKHENILSFEPIDILSRRLKKAFKGSNIYQLALSNKCSYTKLKIPLINGVLSKARATLNINFKEVDETGCIEIEVQTLPLDTFLENKDIKVISLIKIDVEGHEIKVLEGAINAIKKYKPTIIIEIEQRHHEENIGRIIRFILDLGYYCYYFEPNDLQLYELNSESSSINISDKFIAPESINNYFFFPIHDDMKKRVNDINLDIKHQILK